MKHRIYRLAITLAMTPVALAAQTLSSSSSMIADDAANDGGVVQSASAMRATSGSARPFSRFAIGGAISPMGPGVQLTTFVNSHFNVRATGNVFNYSTSVSTNGFNAQVKLNLASAGVAGDIYPFHNGFRISPGLLFYNGNQLTASAPVAPGTSFTLNGNTFYSANANTATGATPLNGSAVLGLNSTKPAFTITAGWGNTIPRKGGHWSFPFEVGVALTGAPSLSANLTGWACSDQAQTQCTDVASTTNPIALQIQSDLNAQIAQWKNNLDPLKTFPMISFGVAYSFGGGGVR